VGLGVTGLYSVDITLVQEFVPASKRGWLTGLTTTMLPVGVLLGRFLAHMRRPISAGAACSPAGCCLPC
jgi:putative MFS transporter